MGWLIGGDVVAHWWRCGGLLVEMWWLIGRNVVAYWWRSGVRVLWLIGGDVVLIFFRDVNNVMVDCF